MGYTLKYSNEIFTGNKENVGGYSDLDKYVGDSPTDIAVEYVSDAGGIRNLSGTELENRLASLTSRVSSLVSMVSDLFSRPPMEHSDPSWVGFRLYFDPAITDKPAPFRPRWWEPAGRDSGTDSITLTQTPPSATSTIPTATPTPTPTPSLPSITIPTLYTNISVLTPTASINTPSVTSTLPNPTSTAGNPTSTDGDPPSTI